MAESNTAIVARPDSLLGGDGGPGWGLFVVGVRAAVFDVEEVKCQVALTYSSGHEFFGLTLPWAQNVQRIRGRRINRNTMIDLPIATEF